VPAANAIDVAAAASTGPRRLFSSRKGSVEYPSTAFETVGPRASSRRAMRSAPPHRDDDREAERRVVEDYENAALLPHRAFGIEQQIRTGVQPRNERPRSYPDKAWTRQVREKSLGCRS
jgi:hypothetical protein